MAGRQRVSAGLSHACAIRSGGTVWCWGLNHRGQLGNGVTSWDAYRPVQVDGIEGAVSVSASADHTCALLEDGTVKCWGSISGNECGGRQTTTPTRIAAVSCAVALTSGWSLGYVGGLAIDVVAAGHTCALLADGTVRCWGANFFGQLGDGTEISSVQSRRVVGLSGVVAVSAGGTYYRYVTEAPESYEPCLAADACLGGHTCALLEDGRVQCWGSNARGQLGDGTRAASAEPVTVDGLSGTVVGIEAGGEHTCALMAGGGVSCWGDNTFGQLGDGGETAPTGPVATELMSDAVGLAAGAAHTCARLDDGRVLCWGDNRTGLLGHETSDLGPEPVEVAGLGGAIAMSAGMGFTCAELADDDIWCVGRDVSSLPVAKAGVDDASDVAVGGGFVCALRDVGDVWCWGVNDTGQLGDRSHVDREVPAPVVNLSGVVSVSAGGDHTCAVVDDGSVRCWGDNDHGEMGQEQRVSYWEPFVVEGVSGAVDVSTSTHHTCALIEDGTVWCWGGNEHRELGDGTTASRWRPAPVPGVSSARAVSTRRHRTCVLLEGGDIRCWGEPVDEPSFGFRDVTGATDISTSCAVVGGGAVECWEGAARPVPSGAVDVSGTDTACALLDDRSLRCWSGGSHHDYHDGAGLPGTDASSPVARRPLRVPGAAAVTVRRGWRGACAVATTGEVWCWGSRHISSAVPFVAPGLPPP